MPGRTTLPQPPALAREDSRTFPGRREEVGQAQAFLARFLDGCPAADDAILLVSELAANAVTHSASGHPGGIFTVRARLHRDHSVHTEVEDQGSAWDGELTTAQRLHGLHLLRELSATCGTQRGATGWITWFTITPGP
jgi:serine/threonine-protein kinase RsbW